MSMVQGNICMTIASYLFAAILNILPVMKGEPASAGKSFK